MLCNAIEEGFIGLTQEDPLGSLGLSYSEIVDKQIL